MPKNNYITITSTLAFPKYQSDAVTSYNKFFKI